MFRLFGLFVIVTLALSPKIVLADDGPDPLPLADVDEDYRPSPSRSNQPAEVSARPIDNIARPFGDASDPSTTSAERDFDFDDFRCVDNRFPNILIKNRKVYYKDVNGTPQTIYRSNTGTVYYAAVGNYVPRIEMEVNAFESTLGMNH